VEVDVEVLASGKLECSGQHEYISQCRIVMVVICNNIVFLSNLYECRRCITITVPPLICIFTPIIVIHLPCSYKFDKNTMLLKIKIITILQRDVLVLRTTFKSSTSLHFNIHLHKTLKS
jgi:hypothetical protein